MIHHKLLSVVYLYANIENEWSFIVKGLTDLWHCGSEKQKISHQI